MKTIGNKIKELRTNKGMTQQELADNLNVSRSSITNWENERNYPDIQLIVMLSDLFEVSLDNLLKGDQEVIKKITNDTKVRKKQSKQLRVFYFLSAVVLFMVLFFGVPLFYNASVFSENQIKSVEVTEDEIIVETRLPFYRKNTGYMISSSKKNPWNVELQLTTTISIFGDKEDKIVIPLDDKNVFDDVIGVDFLNSFDKKYFGVRIDDRGK
ncbi:helix-turn-helix domain-containing protein [Enterococcus faecalis]